MHLRNLGEMYSRQKRSEVKREFFKVKDIIICLLMGMIKGREEIDDVEKRKCIQERKFTG